MLPFSAPPVSTPARPRRGYGTAVILPRDDGRVLAISRGTDIENWGLPGGKTEPGETFEEAAVRELYEETGVDARASRLVPVLERYEARVHAVIFLLQGRVVMPAVLESHPFEGFVDWKTPAELLGPKCRHRGENIVAFSRVGLLG